MLQMELDDEQRKFRYIFKCVIWHTNLKCINQWIQEFDLKIWIQIKEL